MIKVAILEASHWHVPLYLDALESDDIQIVAVSDAELAHGPAIAERFSARHYENYEQLLESESFDFAFTFGRHRDMAEMATALIDRNIPFAIEKPSGVNADEVRQLGQRAADKGLFVSIPLIFRFSDLLHNLQELGGPPPASWDHMSFRFIAGPLARYVGANCGWMLDRKSAAGGCAINLAVHPIDLFQKLVGEDVATVSAQMIDSPGPADVEVFSAMMLTTASGKICCIETGYTYPGGTSEQREFSFTMSSQRCYIRSRSDGFQVVHRDGPKHENVTVKLETDAYYAVFVRNTLKEFLNGEKPPADLADMARVMNVIDCAYLSASRGGAMVECPTL